MNSQSNSFVTWRNLALVVCLLAFGFLVTGKVGAQSAAKAAGELVSANRATINGSSAISGMTVFSNNRIRAAERGVAIINLGKLGRLELGAETDLTLRFSAGNLGGALHTGRAVVSAPAGVTVSVSTAKGLVSTDGLQAAVLTIEVDDQRARVITHRGKAKVVSGGNIERVEEGEEVAFEPQPRGAGWRHRRLIAAGAAGAAGIAIAGQLAGQAARPAAAATSPSTETFTNLLSASVKSSANQVTASNDRDPNQFFETTMSCRDHDNKKCKKKSKKKPKDDDDDDNDNQH